MQDKKIGIQLKKARLESGLSQDAVASKLGLTWEMISRYENGRSSAHKHLNRLAEVYKKPVSYFVADPGQPYEGFDLKMLAQSLREEGIGYNKSVRNVCKSLSELSGKGIEADLASSSSFYEITNSLSEKYPDLFALELDSIAKTNGTNFPASAIGLFSQERQAKDEQDLVLCYDGMEYSLSHYDVDSLAAPLAVLVKVEQSFE